jgi:phage shock protein C
MVNKIRTYFESNLFGVCSYLGEKLDMPSSKIRLFFIYASFLTAGSPVIVYMTMAFIIKLKDYIKGKRSPIWDF